MEFKDILRFATKHYKLLILGAILGGLVGLFVAYMSPAPYEATSKILISRTKSDKGSDFGYLTDAQLIQTYAYILKTRPILDIVEDKVDSKVNTDNVKVSQVPETLILQITVQDENPQKAAYLANAFAEAMVLQSQQLQGEQYELQEEGLSSQIAAVQAQIDELEAMYDKQESTVNESIMDDVDKQILAYRSEILRLQKEIATIKTPENVEQEYYVIDKKSRLDEIQPLLSLYQEIRTNLELLGRPYQAGSAPEDTTLSRLKTTINQYQEVNLTLVNSLEAIRLEKVQRAPTVVTIENAVIPTDRTSLSFVLNPIIASGVGLIIAMLAGLVLQRKRIKITSQEDVLQNLGLEMIGTIKPLSVERPRMSIDLKERALDSDGKSFYDLRAYLEYQRIKKPFKSLLITSFGSEAGKSTVASNLAANYALGGDEIVLIDANFSKADQHIRFKVENESGLTDLLFRDRAYNEEYLQNTVLEKLTLLPIGSYHPEPFQLIDPEKLSKVLGEIGTEEKLVIIDGPSLMDLNTRLMAASVDRILVVMREGIYSLDGLEETLNDLEQDRVKILGVVLNEQTVEKEITSEEAQKSSSSLPKRITQFLTSFRSMVGNKNIPTVGMDSPEQELFLEKTNPHIEKNLEIAEAIQKSKLEPSIEQANLEAMPSGEKTSSVDMNPIEVIPDPAENQVETPELVEVVPDHPNIRVEIAKPQKVKSKQQKENDQKGSPISSSTKAKTSSKLPKKSTQIITESLDQVELIPVLKKDKHVSTTDQSVENSTKATVASPKKSSRKTKMPGAELEIETNYEKFTSSVNDTKKKTRKAVRNKDIEGEGAVISQESLPNIDLVPPKKKKSLTKVESEKASLKANKVLAKDNKPGSKRKPKNSNKG